MSAPSGPIQLIPPGFLQMLQVKNLGRLPDTLLGTYQPTLDMLEWLMATQRDVEAGSVALPPGTIANQYIPMNPAQLQIPEKQWWYVTNFSIIGVVPAGDSILGGIGGAYLEPNQPLYHQLGPMSPYNSGGVLTEDLAVTWSCSPRRFFPPLTDFAASVSQIVSVGGITLSAYIEFARLPN